MLSQRSYQSFDLPLSNSLVNLSAMIVCCDLNYEYKRANGPSAVLQARDRSDVREEFSRASSEEQPEQNVVSNRCRILSNLMEAARDQEQKISQLDRNIESLRGYVSPDTNVLKG